MNEEGAKRQIIQIADGTIILKDTFSTPTGTIEKQKLVQLYPDDLAWTSTHLTGPNKYSQFLYRISAKGDDASILDFTGLHLEYSNEADVELLAKQFCREDAAAWKLLAKAMAEEIT